MLKEALLRMLEKAISYDVILLVGRNGQEVRCHSFMLSARSDVFQAMLESPLIGAETERDGEGRAIVPMPDVDKEFVTCFIRYLYTDDVDLTQENVMPLLYLARKYLIQTLTDKCQQLITAANLEEPENAVEIFHQAFLFDMEDLMDDSMKIINQSTRQCLESAAFRSLPQECVRKIIADDHHQVEEETIYRNVMRWCEEECQRRGLSESDEEFRNVLGDILYEIRFPNIDARFFRSSIEKRSLLTEQEKQEIETLLARQDNTCSRKSYKGRFKCKPRNICQRVIRMTEGGEAMLLDQDQHIIAFQSSVDCLMHGIVTYGLSQIETPEKFKILIDLKDDNNGTIVRDEFWVESVPKTKLYDVRFQKAVEIEADRQYKISMELADDNWHWMGKLGRHSVPFRDGEVIFTGCGSGTEETNMLGGQIPGLILS